jgi:hypothetical protein
MGAERIIIDCAGQPENKVFFGFVSMISNLKAKDESYRISTPCLRSSSNRRFLSIGYLKRRMNSNNK